MLAWARPSFAKKKNSSSRRRVPQKHKPSLAISLRREGLPWARRTPAQNNNQPRLRELFNQNTQLHTISRLGESHSPKRDEHSPKLQTLRLSDVHEQIEGTHPCISRLGEPDSPERELQVLTLIHAHTLLQRPKTRITTYQFIQHHFITLISTFELENILPTTQLCITTKYKTYHPIISKLLGPIPMQQSPKSITPNSLKYSTKFRASIHQNHTKTVKLR